MPQDNTETMTAADPAESEATPSAKPLRPGARSHYLKMAAEISEIENALGPRIEAKRLDEPNSELFRDEAFDKVVHFIRHGEGEHNVFAYNYYETHPNPTVSAYALPDVPHDPELTSTGEDEAKAAGSQLMRVLDAIPVNEDVAVVTSSLRRTLATTTVAMTVVPESQRKRLRKPIATELCREKYGVNSCDCRSPIAVLGVEYPNIDFSQITSDEDPEADPARPREKVVELALRADKFLRWLRESFSERHIVVVTHSAFLSTMLYLALEEKGTESSSKLNTPAKSLGLDVELPAEYPHDKLGGWFATGELRSYGLRFGD